MPVTENATKTYNIVVLYRTIFDITHTKTKEQLCSTIYVLFCSDAEIRTEIAEIIVPLGTRADDIRFADRRDRRDLWDRQGRQARQAA